MQRRLGLERVVVVQSSAYGTDNRCMLDAVAALGAGARGVAMVAADVAEAELGALRRRGVCGLRFLMAPGGVTAWDEAERLAARAHGHGLHVNLQMDGRGLPEREAVLRRFPGPLVVDHVGMFVEPVAPEHPGFRALLRLVETGRVWVKVSAPYAGGWAGPPPYPWVGALVQALAQAAPDRLLWGSNWPHPFTVVVRGRPPEDDAMLLDLLLDWVEDERVRARILGANAAGLFGFAA
jgi:D-galactarolactone isomerase